MKRFTKLLLLTVCALSLIVFSVGCVDDVDDSSTEPHTHVAESTFYSDAQYHWQKCECGEIMNKKPHEFTELVISAQPTKTQYLVGETFDKTGMEVEGKCACGNIGITDYTVEYQTENATAFANGDTHVVIKKDNLFANVDVTVGKIKIAKPAADETEFVYNGSEQTYVIAENERYTVTGNKQTNAGSYTVTVALNDTENVTWADGSTGSFNYTFIIAKKEVSVVWDKAESYVYNDTELAAPTAKMVDVDGKDVALTVNGDAINGAGEFTFTAATSDTNYALVNAECTVNVLLYNEITKFEMAAELKCDETPQPSAEAKHGEPKYYYCESLDGEFAEITDKTVFEADKTYYVKAIVAAADNYVGAESEAKTFIKKHEYDENGKCVKGDAYNTAGITYAYNESSKTYYVKSGDASITEAIVLPAYNDGEHGEYAVTYVANSAFIKNENLKKAVFPESVTDLGGIVFAKCINLEYVSMPGVKSLKFSMDGRPDAAEDKDGQNNFMRCLKLKTVIVASGFTTDCQQFINDNPDKYPEYTTFALYVNGSDGTPVLKGNNNLWNGKVYYKGDTSKCFRWNFDENGEIVTGASEHTYGENGICSGCGKFGDTLTKGVNYGYRTEFTIGNNTYDAVYYVTANNSYDRETVEILGEYDDGLHGKKPVTYVENGAFKGNETIKKVILPDSVKSLDGNVFEKCTNLEYVSMTGITNLEYNGSKLGYGADRGNNFWNCTALKYVVLNPEFNTNCQQFFADEAKVPDVHILDLYVNAASGTPKLAGNTNLWTGNVFYKGDANKCFQWSEVDGVIKHGPLAHDFKDGKCTACGKYDPAGVTYSYDSENKCYYVAAYNGTSAVVKVFAKYDDGTNGEKEVKYIAQECAWGTVVTKIILPESVTDFKGNSFQYAENLEYISMTGVTHISTGNNFIDNAKITTVIVNKKFNLDNQQFKKRNGEPSTIVVYVDGTKAESTFSFNIGAGNEFLTGIVYYKTSGEEVKCLQWKFDENGEIAKGAAAHNFVDGICTNCGEKDAMGVSYAYDTSKNVYYVKAYNGTSETLNVFGEWNDGMNGLHDVKYIAARVFEKKEKLKRVILHENIDSLEGWVFASCSNLEYVSMRGVTNLEYHSPYGGEGRDNNFRECEKLKTVIVGNSFTTNCGQFGSSNTIETPVLDLYVYGEGTATYSSGDNLLSGKVYYYSAESKSGCWHYDENGVATLWN